MRMMLLMWVLLAKSVAAGATTDEMEANSPRSLQASTSNSSDAREQDCIIDGIDFENSTVGSLMTRGFPLFTEFGLNSGTIGDAYFELEPMYDFNIARWKEFTSNSSLVWRRQERKYRGGQGGSRIDVRSFMELVGYDLLIDGYAGTLRSAAFERMYGPTYGACSENKYCREAAAFVDSVGGDPAEPGYGVSLYHGPLGMNSPFTSEFHLTDPEGVTFSAPYLEALGALPEAYDRDAYLAFGQRFGLGAYAGYFAFSYKNVSVADEPYIATGSSNYQGQECHDPEPSGITYTGLFEDSWLVGMLSPIQKARFEILSNATNLLDMIAGVTSAPSPAPRSPTTSPTLSPILSLAQNIAPGLLVGVCALLCTLVV